MRSSDFAKRRSYDDPKSGLTLPILSEAMGVFGRISLRVCRIADVIAVEHTFDNRPHSGSEDIAKSDFFVLFLFAH